MLVQRPGIAENVPVAKFDDLQVACGMPPLQRVPQNWGNFPAYQGTLLQAR